MVKPKIKPSITKEVKPFFFIFFSFEFLVQSQLKFRFKKLPGYRSFRGIVQLNFVIAQHAHLGNIEALHSIFSCSLLSVGLRNTKVRICGDTHLARIEAFELYFLGYSQRNYFIEQLEEYVHQDENKDEVHDNTANLRHEL